MFEAKFLATIPGKTLDGALELAKKLLWNLSWRTDEGRWVLFAGDRVLFESDSEDAIWAFIYGLAMAYSTLPKPLLADVQEYRNAIRDGNSVEFLRRKGWPPA